MQYPVPSSQETHLVPHEEQTDPLRYFPISQESQWAAESEQVLQDESQFWQSPPKYPEAHLSQATFPFEKVQVDSHFAGHSIKFFYKNTCASGVIQVISRFAL